MDSLCIYLYWFYNLTVWQPLHRRLVPKPATSRAELYTFVALLACLLECWQIFSTSHKSLTRDIKYPAHEWRKGEGGKSWKIFSRKMIPNFVFCTPSNLKKILFKKFVTNYENVQRIPSAFMQLSLFVRNKRESQPNKRCLRGVEALSALQFLLGFVDCTWTQTINLKKKYSVIVQLRHVVKLLRCCFDEHISHHLHGKLDGTHMCPDVYFSKWT
jgi:hypothetical protein